MKDADMSLIGQLGVDVYSTLMGKVSGTYKCGNNPHVQSSSWRLTDHPRSQEVDHQSCAWSVGEGLCCFLCGVTSRSDDAWVGGMWPTGVISVEIRCERADLVA